MPAMGDSVSEGTILEWHKKEGDPVSEDETLVEVSTDKVDAEVPSPAAGTVAKVHAAEGETVAVGAPLAEIAPNGGAPAAVGNGGPAASPAEAAPAEPAPAAEPEAAPAPAASGEQLEITMPQMGESVSEGVILEWAKQPGDEVQADETIVEISTDKVDAEVPAPASGVMGEILAEAGETVTVGEVIARMSAGDGARPPRAGRERVPRSRRPPAPRAPRRAPSRRRTRTPRPRPWPAASPPRTGSTSPRSRAPAPRAASRRPTCWRPPATAPPPRLRPPHRPPPRPPPPKPPSSRARPRCSPATWTSRGRSPPRPRSARSRSRRWTPAAGRSRRPATASPSPT